MPKQILANKTKTKKLSKIKSKFEKEGGKLKNDARKTHLDMISENDKEKDQEKFTQITTRGVMILPRNVNKYCGGISTKTTGIGKRWQATFKDKYKHLGSKTYASEEEAKAFLVRVNTRENLPIDNVIYLYNDEYYCVLTGSLRNQLMKFSIEDIDLVENHTWCAVYVQSTRSFYAVTHLKGTKALMSYPQMLFPDMGPGVSGDHISRISLDNTRSNLRCVSRITQIVNQRLRSDNTSGVKGIYRNEKGKCWHASWVDNDGKKLTPRFSDTKYGGSDEAKKAAIDAREVAVANTIRYNEGEI